MVQEPNALLSSHSPVRSTILGSSHYSCSTDEQVEAQESLVASELGCDRVRI